MNVITDEQINAMSKKVHVFGGGLRLVTHGKNKYWVFRYTRNRKTVDMGLGTYPDLSIAEAMAIHRRYWHAKKQGIDPIAFRDRKKVQSEKIA